MGKVYISGRNQTKTVNPSNVQQTIEPDNGYTGLSAVVVNPISALMPENLEDFVMRKNTMPGFSLSLSGDVPEYACYNQTNLVAVYGELGTIGIRAFSGCHSLSNIELSSSTYIGEAAFYNCRSLTNIDCRNVESLGNNSMFQKCSNLKYIDVRKCVFLGYGVFSECSSANVFDFTSVDSAPKIVGSSLPDSRINWKAVFKNDTVKAAVQSATNWSTFASCIYTVAEIEALYGDTYDNLYLQWFGHARN